MGLGGFLGLSLLRFGNIFNYKQTVKSCNVYLQSVFLTTCQTGQLEILQESKATDLKDRLMVECNFFWRLKFNFWTVWLLTLIIPLGPSNPPPFSLKFLPIPYPFRRLLLRRLPVLTIVTECVCQFNELVSLLVPLAVNNRYLDSRSKMKCRFQAREGGGVLPYMGYVGMCRCKGYGFQVVYSRIGCINQSVWV